MTILVLDTKKYIKRLMEAGVSQAEAEIHAEFLSLALGERFVSDENRSEASPDAEGIQRPPASGWWIEKTAD